MGAAFDRSLVFERNRKLVGKAQLLRGELPNGKGRVNPVPLLGDARVGIPILNGPAF